MATSVTDLEEATLAAIEQAPDLTTGYKWLSEEYESSTWDNPTAAREILADQGRTLRQKFRKDEETDASDLYEVLPFKIEEIPLRDDIEDDKQRRLQQVDDWVAANNAFVNETDNTSTILNKRQIENLVPDIALGIKQTINNPSRLEDIGNRMLLGAIGPLGEQLGVPTEEIQAKTNPKYNDDYVSYIASGLGSLGAGVGITALNPVAGVVYAVGQVGGGAVQTGREVYEETGELETAVTAGSIEGVISGIAAKLGIKAQSKLANIVTDNFKKQISRAATTEALSEGLIKKAFKSSLDVLSVGSLESAEETIQQFGSNLARAYGFDDYSNLTKGLKETAISSIFVGSAGVPLSAGAGRAAAILKKKIAPTVTSPEQVAEQQENKELVPDVKISEETGTAEETLVAPTITEEKTITGVEEAPQYEVDVESSIAKDIAKTAPSFNELGVSSLKEVQLGFDFDGTADIANSPVIFKTENGEKFVETKDSTGLVRVTGDDTVKAQADKVVYVEPEVAAHISILKNLKTPEGEPILKYDDNDNVILESSYVTPDLDIIETPQKNTQNIIPHQIEPAVGLVPIEISKVGNNDQISAWASNVGTKISEIVQQTKGEGKTFRRKLGQRFIDDTAWHDELRNLFTEKNVRGETVTTLKDQRLADSTRDQVADQILSNFETEEDAINFLTSKPTTNQSNFEIAAGSLLLHRANERMEQAEETGDVATKQRYKAQHKQLQPYYAEVGTETARSLRTFKIFQSPKLKTRELITAVEDRIEAEVLKEEGITQRDVDAELKELASIDKQLTEKKDLTEEEAQNLDKRKATLREKSEKRIKKAEERAQREFPPEERQKYRQLLELVESIDPSSTARERTISEVSKIEDRLHQKGYDFWGLAQAYRNMNLLGANNTVAVNLVSTLFNAPVGGLATSIGGRLRGTLTLQDSKQLVKEIVKAWPAGKRAAREAFINGGLSKYEDTDKVYRIDDFPPKLQPFIRMISIWARATAATDMAINAPLRQGINEFLMKPDSQRYFEKVKEAGSPEANLSISEEQTRQVDEKTISEIESLRKLGIPVSEAEAELMIDENRYRRSSEEIQKEAEFMANLLTFRAVNRGTAIEAITNGIIKIADTFAPAKVGGAKPLKFFTVFMGTAGRIMDVGLDFFPPTNIVRQITTKDDLPQFYRDYQMGSLVLGSILGTTMLSLGMPSEDDPYPSITVTGSGPMDIGDKQKNRETGITPYSLKLGDTYIPLATIPTVAPLLASIGGYFDHIRYGNKSKVNQKEAAAYIATSTLGSLFDQPFLKLASDVGEIYSAAMGGSETLDVGEAVSTLAKAQLANTIQSITPFARIAKESFSAFENPIQSKLNFKSQMVSFVPFAEAIDGTRPAINYWGTPVLENKEPLEKWRLFSRFYSTPSDNPVDRFIATKGYSLPGLNTRVPEIYTKKVYDEREKVFGSKYKEKLNKVEQWEVRAAAGDRLYAATERFMNRYKLESWNEVRQEELNKILGGILNEEKRKLLSRERESLRFMNKLQ